MNGDRVIHLKPIVRGLRLALRSVSFPMLRSIRFLIGISTLVLASKLSAQDTLSKIPVVFSAAIEGGILAVENYERTSVITTVPAITILGVNSIFRSRAAISMFESGRVSGYGDVYVGHQLKSRSRITLAVEGEAGVGTYRGKVSGHFFQTGIIMGMSESIISQFHVSNAFDTARYTAVSGAVVTPLKMHDLAIVPTLRFTHARGRMFGELLMETSYERERLQLVTQVGMTTDPSAHRILAALPSASISATLRILKPVAITFNASRFPPDFARGMSASSQLSLGISLARSFPKSLSATPVFPSQSIWIQSDKSDSLNYLTLRISGATTVEVRGTFTGWKAMPMIKGKNGEWKLPIVLPSGVYSIAIRVDGGSWDGPSGLARAQDEFGENYGLLVVR